MVKMAEDDLAHRIEIDILVEAGDWFVLFPSAKDITSAAAAAALSGAMVKTVSSSAIELSILLTDDASIADLNRQWRGKSGSTNVLSFPAETDVSPTVTRSVSPGGAPEGAPILLGDVAVSLETLTAEALDAGIAPEDHLRHLIVHGVLHLCGYDHESDAAAHQMESCEIVILKALGVSDPYAAAERRLEGVR